MIPPYSVTLNLVFSVTESLSLKTPSPFVPSSAVIAQYYDVDVNKEYAIRGNSVLMKCQIPSYVADFVRIESWHTDQNQSFYINSTENDEGWSRRLSHLSDFSLP